jgi:formyltetrahydrofolate deformylase
MSYEATLLIFCLDQKGIVAKITNCLFENNCNIIQSDQYSTDHINGQFFLRIAFSYETSIHDKNTLKNNIMDICKELNANFELLYCEQNSCILKNRAGILVSKYDHCLMDILYRWKTGELDMIIPVIISNHDDLRYIAEMYDVPYHHIPTGNKPEQEKEILNLVKENTDFLILARYMQILSPEFLSEYSKKIINIHHSFLPSFKGANPYKQAWDRGVKIIGATAHYVTESLDEGPIITQEVTDVTHKDNLKSMINKGKDLEKIVLSTAIKAHLENRIIEYDNKTIVFE